MQIFNLNNLIKMKKIIPGLAIVVIALAACNSKENKSAKVQNSNTDTMVRPIADTTNSVNNQNNSTSVKAIVDPYLQLKNALAQDNSREAAAKGKALEASFHKFNTAAFSESQKKIFTDIAETAIEDAEHIGKNGGNIDHQREHFEMLSQDIYDLVKAFGSGEVLFRFFCPMYNQGKGASWISETKEIRNPYMGKSMPTCGTLKEEIK
jgi:hypothetical protein